MLKVTEQLRKGEIITVDGQEIRYHKIDYSTNGAPRYVVHFLSLGIEMKDYGHPILAKFISAKVYKAKWYGGGMVLESFNLHDDLKWNIERVKEWYARVNAPDAQLSKREKETIADNLKAYLANFKPIRIEREDYGKGFYVFQEGNDTWVQFCYNVDYLNGWLYGAVQAKCKQLSVKE